MGGPWPSASFRRGYLLARLAIHRTRRDQVEPRRRTRHLISGARLRPFGVRPGRLARVAGYRYRERLRRGLVLPGRPGQLIQRGLAPRCLAVVLALLPAL